MDAVLAMAQLRSIGWIAIVMTIGCSYPDVGFERDGAPVEGDEGVADSTFVDTTVDTTLDTAAPAVVDSTAAEATVDTSVVDTGIDAVDTAPEVVVDTVPVFDTLVARGATWRYLDDGIAPTTSAWRGSGTFSDSAWKSGPAQLGYGDGDEQTVISSGPPDSGLRHHAYYFRHTFSVTGAADYYELVIELLRDDGAVIYLNGVELVRSNMPAGTISHTTFASSSVSGAEEDEYFSYAVPPAALREGSNVIAVEVHQISLTSTDISFDLSLTGWKL
jgi:hypothetical protein